jgi:hypothetical protein
MGIIRKYKTISILIVLIMIFGILAIFTKIADLRQAKTGPEIQTTVTSIPTPTPDLFIHPESFNIPSSYMGYVVTKTTNGELGKGVLEYGTRSADLTGTEWEVKKNNVIGFEYDQVKPFIASKINSEIDKREWKTMESVNGKQLSVNVPPSGDLNNGYIKVSDGKVQLAFIAGGRDNSGSVNIKIFLSNVYSLKDL